jgi:hypothetical protein
VAIRKSWTPTSLAEHSNRNDGAASTKDRDQRNCPDGIAEPLPRFHMRDGSAQQARGAERATAGDRSPDTLCAQQLRTEFAADSLLEGDGFEPSVPRRGQHFFETAPERGDDKPAW